MTNSRRRLDYEFVTETKKMLNQVASSRFFCRETKFKKRSLQKFSRVFSKKKVEVENINFS